MRRIFLVAALFITAPIMAQQDFPRAEIFGGYSYLHTNLLLDDSIPKGWNASIAGYVRRNIGIEAEFSGHYASHEFPGGSPFSDKTHVFMVGPKYAVPSGKVTPWVHALFGAAHVKSQGEGFIGPYQYSNTWFAWAAGGGVDAEIHKHLAIRVIQADYIRVNGRALFWIPSHAGLLPGAYPGSSNNFRLSVGVVWTSR